MYRRPDLSVYIGALEGVVTLSGLIISMGSRAMLTASVPEGYAPITVEQVVNFLVSGGFAYLSWSRGLRALHQFSRGDP